MNWKNTNYQYEATAKLAYYELKEAGIKVSSEVLISGNNYIVSWLPMGKKQFEKGFEIAMRHIFQSEETVKILLSQFEQ